MQRSEAGGKLGDGGTEGWPVWLDCGVMGKVGELRSHHIGPWSSHKEFGSATGVIRNKE